MGFKQNLLSAAFRGDVPKMRSIIRYATSRKIDLIPTYTTILRSCTIPASIEEVTSNIPYPVLHRIVSEESCFQKAVQGQSLQLIRLYARLTPTLVSVKGPTSDGDVRSNLSPMDINLDQVRSPKIAKILIQEAGIHNMSYYDIEQLRVWTDKLAKIVHALKYDTYPGDRTLTEEDILEYRWRFILSKSLVRRLLNV